MKIPLFRDDGVASGMWEGWSVLTAVAAVTTRVAIGSFVTRVAIGSYVTCTSFRNPALLATMADTVRRAWRPAVTRRR